MRHGRTRRLAAKDVPPEWHKKILHARLLLGDQALMASDASPGRDHKPQGFSVSLDIKTPAEAERVFHALAESGSMSMPIRETFWAERFGVVHDRFGIPWMINCSKPM